MQWVFDAAGPLFASPARLEGAAFGQTQSLGTPGYDFSALHRLACTHRYRRFAGSLTGAHARLAAKVVVSLSFHGACTRNTVTS